LKWKFTRSSGPGGQHVNTTNSKCELSIASNKFAAFVGDEKVLEKFHSLFKVYLTEKEKNICIKSQEFRVQQQNKDKCLEKLSDALNQSVRMIQVNEPSKQQKERISIL
jgi:protein subunit release factor B